MSSKEEFLKRFRSNLVEIFHSNSVADNHTNDKSTDFTVHSLPETSISDYQIIRVIGEGGMGTVYEAVHLQLRRKVALKILKKHHETSAKIRQRFLREIRSVGLLSHPKIVQAFDARYEEDGPVLLAFELLDGADLAKMLKGGFSFSVSDACEITKQIAEGLQHIQDNGLVHRDIKPSNIFIALTRDPKGNIVSVSVKILDLGLAILTSESTDITLTTSGQIIGTIDYIAPEQIQSSRGVDIRTDLYSLGCTLHHLLAGEPPYSEYPGTFNKLYAHKEYDPKPLNLLNKDVPDELSDIVLRLLSKNPDDRYLSPSDLCNALSPYCDSHDLLEIGRKIVVKLDDKSTSNLDMASIKTINEDIAIIPTRDINSQSDSSYRTWKWVALPILFSLTLLLSFIFLKEMPSGLKETSMPQKEISAAYPKTNFVLMLDGIDDAVKTPFKYLDGSPITFEVWFTPFATLDGRNKEIVSNAETAGITLCIKEDKHLRFMLHDGEKYVPVIIQNSMIPGEITHAAAVYNGVSVQLYVNGSRSGPAIPVRNQHRPSPLPIHLGANPDPVLAGRDIASLRDCFHGLIHQFRISSGTRYLDDFTPDKTLASDPSTQLLYHIDSGEGDTIKDLSGNGYHGQIIGGEWVEKSELGDRHFKPAFSWPEEWPTPTIAPLTSTKAKNDQKAWAEYLGIPPEKIIELGDETVIHLVLIPPGEFLIGTELRRRTQVLESTVLQINDYSKRQIKAEGPQHLVKITRPFYISKYETTQTQYHYFCKTTAFEPRWMNQNADPLGNESPKPDFTLSNGNDYPATSITWNDAIAFCDWLSKNAEFSTVTLPTEAQWEYACRAGKLSDWSFGDDQNSLNLHCWNSDNSSGSIHKVGLLLPNQWGLYDMHGNATEWCFDYYRRGAYTTMTQIDPVVGSIDHFHNVRGGSWAQWPVMCRSAFRSYMPATFYSKNIGFRIIAEIESPLLNQSNSGVPIHKK